MDFNRPVDCMASHPPLRKVQVSERVAKSKWQKRMLADIFFVQLWMGELCWYLACVRVSSGESPTEAVVRKPESLQTSCLPFLPIFLFFGWQLLCQLTLLVGSQLLCQLKKKVPPCPLTSIPMLRIIPICDVISYISRGMPLFFLLLDRIRPCCMANSVHRITLFQSLLLIPGKYAPNLPSASSSRPPNERPKWQN